MTLKDILSILPGENGLMIIKGFKKLNELEKKVDKNNKIKSINKEYEESYMKVAGRVMLSFLYLSYGVISCNQHSLNPNKWNMENSQKKYNIENVVKE
jgi:hypothetical protein